MTIQVFPTPETTVSGLPVTNNTYYIGYLAWSTKLSRSATGYKGYEYTVNQTLPAGFYIYNGFDSAGGYFSIYPENSTSPSFIFASAQNVVLTTAALTSYNIVYPANWNTENVTGGTYFTSAVVGVAYGNGYFVAGGTGVVTLAISTDGINWTTAAGGNANIPFNVVETSRIQSSITFQNGFFMMGSLSGRGISISTNATTWVTRAVMTSNIAIQRVAYGNSYYLAGTANITGYRSTDLTTWTTIAFPSSLSESARTLHFQNSFFIVNAGAGDGVIYISTAGGTWATRQTGLASYPGIGAYGAGFYVLPGLGTGNVAISSDAATWTLVGTSVGAINGAMTYDGTYFYLPGSSNSIAISTDALNWYVLNTNGSTISMIVYNANSKIFAFRMQISSVNLSVRWTTATMPAGVNTNEKYGFLQGYTPTVTIY